MLNFPMVAVQTLDKLSEGAYSVSFKAQDESFNKYIVKEYNMLKTGNAFQREAQTLRLVTPHPNIGGYYGCVQVKNQGKLLLELCEGGSLRDLIDRESSYDVLGIMLKLIEAVKHLHSFGCVHRDLRPENVFFTHLGKLKLGNFSHCISQAELDSLYGIELSEDIEIHTCEEYRAPELFDLSSEQPINTQADVWALGCVFYELITRSKLRSIPSDRLENNLQFPQGTNRFWENLVRKMLVSDPTQRINAKEVYFILLEGESSSTKVKDKHRSTKNCVRAASKADEKVCDDVYIRSLVDKSYKKPFKIPKFYKAIVSRPLNNLNVALKCLVLVHRYLIEGSTKVFSIDARNALEKISKLKNSREKVGDVVKMYADLLIQKIELSDDGKWTVCTSIEMSRKMIKYWTEMHFLSSFVIDLYRNEVLGLVISTLIEEQSRLSMSISSFFANFPPNINIVNLVNEFQEHLSVLKEFVSKFRLKYPLLYKPLDLNSNARNAFKIRRNTVSVVKFDNRERKDSSVEFSTDMSVSRDNSSFENRIDWDISQVDLNKLENLGESVVKASYKHTPVVLKKARQEDIARLPELRHPNLLLFIGVLRDTDTWIVSEFCEGGNLYELLHESKFSLSVDQRANLCREIAQCLGYLHSIGVLHKNLHSKEILLRERIGSQLDHIKVKINHPQKIIGDRIEGWITGNSESVDVYSFGLLVWEVFAYDSLLFKFEKPLLEDIDTVDIPDIFRSIIKNALNLSVSERLTFIEILKGLI